MTAFSSLRKTYDFRKIRPIKTTLKVTVNKKLNGSQAMQKNKSKNEVVPVQDQKKEEKTEKNKISVKRCEELS